MSSFGSLKGELNLPPHILHVSFISVSSCGWAGAPVWLDTRFSPGLGPPTTSGLECSYIFFSSVHLSMKKCQHTLLGCPFLLVRWLQYIPNGQIITFGPPGILRGSSIRLVPHGSSCGGGRCLRVLCLVVWRVLRYQASAGASFSSRSRCITVLKLSPGILRAFSLRQL